MATKPRATKANGTKAKTAEEIVSGEAFKEGIDKAMSNYGQFTSFGKENVEAVIQSANIAAKGMETLNNEALAFSRQQMEDGVAMTKAAMTARTVQEFMEVQNDFTKSAFDAYLGQMNKLSDLFSETARDAAEPINERVGAFVELAQTARS